MKYQIYRFGGVTGNSSQLATTGYAYMIEDMTADAGVTMTEVDTAIDVAVTEMEAYTDGVAADLQLNIEDVEDEVNVLALEVDLKLDKPVASALSAATGYFDKPYIYGSWNAPVASFTGFSYTDAVINTKSVVYYNGSFVPILLQGARTSGNFVPNVVNKITAKYTATSGSIRFEYTIEQQDPGTPVTLTYASTFALNMAIRDPQLMTLGGNITFNTPTNITPGAEISMVITGDGSNRTLTFPAFAWMNGAPTSLAAGKNMVIWLFSKGTAVGDVIASYTMQT